MTSHYIKCIVKSSFEAVFVALNKAFSSICSKKIGTADQRVGVVLGERWFFRVNSDVAVLIILEEFSTDKTKIEIISCAGGTGWFQISYNAHRAYAHNVINFLKDSGFKIESVKEISYFKQRGNKP